MSSSFMTPASGLRERIKHKIETHKHRDGWLLPRQETSFADEGTWSNIDADVTPLERRTWGSWDIIGFWCSDSLNAQGWMAPSAIIAAGLTWKEAMYLCRGHPIPPCSTPYADLHSCRWRHDECHPTRA